MNIKIFKFPKISISLIFTAFASIFFISCSSNRFSTELASQNITEALTCDDFKSQAFDALYEVIDRDKATLKSEEITNKVTDKIKSKINALIKNKNVSPDKQKELNEIIFKVEDLMNTMLHQVENNSSLTWKEQIQNLIEFEMQDQSSISNINTSQKIQTLTTEITSLGKLLGLDCKKNPQLQTPPETPLPSESSNESITNTPTPPTLFSGMNRVFSTAYQSCSVLKLPDMDLSVSNAQGITILEEMHPDNIGRKRVISNLSTLVNTHYYLRNIASVENNCLPIKENPLIYDYGGEPDVTNNSLNLFSNSGSGTKVLGIDCSAYVSSGILTAGLKYKAKVNNKAIFVRQNSSKFINAQTSGFDCFENVTLSPSSTLKAGDIVGVKGHVVTIDKLGLDPFGLANIKTLSDCSYINFKNFEITVAQSSPSKNGIGLNKYKVSDYLTESNKMRYAFEQMGYYACLAKFKNKTYTPLDSEWGLLRHKGTKECLTNSVPLIGQSCVKACW